MSGRETADDLRVVTTSWTPGRAAPDQRSEMTTQWLCGEPLRVLEVDEGGRWLRVRGPDGYESWVRRGGVGAAAETDGGWDAAATVRSLGAILRREDGGGAPRFLPWGARAVPAQDDRVRLPDGGTAVPEPSDAVVGETERPARFPPSAEAVVGSALRWRGVPYLWGGRTRQGADCSGFVQAVFAMHGVALPRDSGDQLAAGRADDLSTSPGDLLFFGDGPDALTHVALVVEGSRVVHAAAGNGAVRVDDLDGESPLVRRLRRRRVGTTRPLAGG